jgi:hypothetical protein
MRSRQANVTNPTRMSLAQFSKNLMSSESRGQPDCVAGTTEGVGLESVGQKRFAADVVAALSNPTRKANEEVAELTLTES